MIPFNIFKDFPLTNPFIKIFSMFVKQHLRHKIEGGYYILTFCGQLLVRGFPVTQYENSYATYRVNSSHIKSNGGYYVASVAGMDKMTIHRR